MDSNERLKMFGQLLASDTSRRIIELISDEELYQAEIKNALNIRTTVTIHHLQKLMKLEMVTITNKKLFRRSIDHKYYKMKLQFHIDELRKIV